MAKKILLFINHNLTQRTSAMQMKEEKELIIVDAGHGGARFPGAGYGGVAEKDINLQVALKLGALIENGEYPADMDTLRGLVADICCNNAKRYFNL